MKKTWILQVENKAATPNPKDTEQTNSEPASPQKEEPTKPETVTKAPPVFACVRVSKFRHLHGVPMHKSNNIDNVRNLSMSTFGDCDGLQVNQKFVAYLLSGPGGQVAALQVCSPIQGRGVGQIENTCLPGYASEILLWAPVFYCFKESSVFLWLPCRFLTEPRVSQIEHACLPDGVLEVLWAQIFYLFKHFFYLVRLV